VADEQQGLGIAIIVMLTACLRHVAYETFYRAHQMLTAALLYAVWQHIPPTAQLSPLYVILALLFPTLALLYYSSMTAYRNGIFSSRGRTCMTVSYKGGMEEKDGAADLHISLPRLTQVKAGQYVNLWMPSVSLWSWAQVHPYMIVSWEKNPVDELDVVVQARHGFSARLVRYAQWASPRPVSFPGLVIGPHGTSKDLNCYKSVLAVTSDSGILSVISYVKSSICHGISASRTRRIHLVWQIDQPGKLIVVFCHSANPKEIVPPIESILTELLTLDAANNHVG
jgi:hypothetical protein